MDFKLCALCALLLLTICMLLELVIGAHLGDCCLHMPAHEQQGWIKCIDKYHVLYKAQPAQLVVTDQF